MSNPLEQYLRTVLQEERAQMLHRFPPPIDGRPGIRYQCHGKSVVSFCSNDYLGLLSEPPPRLKLPTAPNGSAGSRLVCGNHLSVRHLEQQFAAFLGYPEAILFPSGYQAALATLPSLLGPNDLVYSDQLNHASLIDGMRLAKTRPNILPHLRRPPKHSPPQRGFSWWVSESTFSMDGDHASPSALRNFRQTQGYTIVDEAHAVGLYDGALGYCAAAGESPTILLCPLGKAFASTGAIVATSSVIAEWIRSHARPYVYSTGPSPYLAEHLLFILDLVRSPHGESRRKHLWNNVRQFSRATGLPSDSPIFPVMVGSNALALDLSQHLLERGWHVQAIRPPTVPHSSARLRITISAAHSPEELLRFTSDLQHCMTTLGLPILSEHHPTPTSSRTLPRHPP